MSPPPPNLSMEPWIHAVLSVVIYLKIAFLVFYGLKYLSLMQKTKGRPHLQNQGKNKKVIKED